MRSIHSINKLQLSNYNCYEEENENKKNTTYFHSNNSIIFTTQFHASYGSIMPGRYFSSGTGYRWGFNGKENDNEVKGNGNSLDFGARVYDSRLGRFLSVDPLQSKFPYESNYIYCSANPLIYSDIDGKEKFYMPDGTYIGKIGTNNKIRVFAYIYTEEEIKTIFNQMNKRIKSTEELNKMISHYTSGFTNSLFNAIIDKKTLLPAFNEGICRSATFRDLVSKSKLTRVTDNSNEGLIGTNGSGEINVSCNSNDADIKLCYIKGLVWEMTNKINIEKLNQHWANLNQTEHEFVFGIILIETEALFNRAKVAFEMGCGYNDPDARMYWDYINSQSKYYSYQDYIKQVATNTYNDPNVMASTENGRMQVKKAYGNQYHKGKYKDSDPKKIVKK